MVRRREPGTEVAVIDAIRQGHYPHLHSKYPAREHARRVADYIRAHGYHARGVIYLESQKSRLIEDDDTPQKFRQRRPFFYLSGCELPDSYLLYDMTLDKLTLFIPPLEPDEVMWSGLPLSPTEALAKYDIDHVLATTDLNIALESYTRSAHPVTAYAIPEQVCADVSLGEFAHTEYYVLRKAIEYHRVRKDVHEISLITKANEVSALAHQAVRERAAAAAAAVVTTKANEGPAALNERDLEAAFIATCISHGCRDQAYPPVVASGRNASILHYLRNDEPLHGQLNLLIDAGTEFNCYCSDVTRTFPLSPSGRFSTESQVIYDIVAEMQRSCFQMLRADVAWEDVHIAAHLIAIKGLLAAGVLRGDIQDIFQSRVSVAFFPHGIGHYLGMDTHDVGETLDIWDPDLIFRYLRVRGKVPRNSVITIEPGIYFCEFILERYLRNPDQSQYVDESVLERYWKVGGVRIEDDVWITQDGYHNLTTAAAAAAGLSAK